MGVSQITPIERDAATFAAIAMAKDMLGTERGALHPQAKLGSLNETEWMKLTEAIVSGWICERSRQLGADRLGDDSFFLAAGEVPEPADLGIVALALPALGDLVARLGLGDRPVGEWSKEHISLFVWAAAELVEDAKTRRAERPSPPSLEEIGLVLGA